MQNRIIKAVTPILASLILSYAGYTYFLQPQTFFSRSRLVLAFLIWILVLFLFYLGLRPFSIDQLLTGRSNWGVAGIVILLNLIAAGYSVRIPYTYLFLPSQTVRISPLSNDTIKLVSYNTELVKEISITNFKNHAGWNEANNQIRHEKAKDQDLIWQGKPGQFVEIEFATCADCGKVRISWNSSDTQNIDLSEPSGDKELILRHEYPSLTGHKFINLLALELSIVLVGLILSNAGKALPDRDSYEERRHGTNITARQFEQPRTGKIASLLRAAQPIALRKQIFPILSLAFLTLAVYGPKIQPILFNDDWSIIFMLKFNLMKPFMVHERRPLHWFLAWLSNQFLPLDRAVYAMDLMLVLISFISAVFIYFLVRQLLKNRADFALLTAALWLVFPNDYTRLYISTLGIRLAFALLLVLMILFTRFMKTEKWLAAVPIIPLLVLSLLMYEGQLGLAFVWPFILMILYWHQISWRKILGMAGYYLAIAVFVYWKLAIQPQIYQDSKIEGLNLPPGEIFTRYFHAVGTVFGGFQFPYRDSSWLTSENMAILVAIVLGLIAIYRISVYLFDQQAPRTDIDKTLKTNLYIFFSGVILWFAGYIPIILNYPPNIYGHLSRVNLFSIPGAALILLAIVHTILASMSESRRVAANLTTALVLMLIFVGSIVHLQTQEAYGQSWAEAKTFYQKLFSQVPDIKEGTHIILELSGYENNGALYRPLFSSSWAAWCAFRVLYDQDDLLVNYKYDRIAVPNYPAFNVLTSTLETDTISTIGDPGKLLVIAYDRQTQTLSVRKDLSRLQDYVDQNGYSPEDRILPLKRPILSRRIVD
ncbi:MAG TPA: hypothetical protein VE136_13720 [Anaerolineales bacterium]|nr:hypothetical protein [Anaerolineales bacterium]